MPKLNKNHISIATLSDILSDQKFWLSLSPRERIRHMEDLRRINYGNAASSRLQRVLEIVQYP